MGRTAGRYTTKHDGLTYTYDASWERAGEGIIWSATVNREGQVVGTPNGQIRHPAGEANVADEVRRSVETWIEKAGVRQFPRY
jgi:hypothetical protein